MFYGPYQGLLRRCLIHLKFYGALPLGAALGRLLCAHPQLRECGADCIVPVPLHARRLAERGYNQALELARPLRDVLGVPLLPELLIRTRATDPQTGGSFGQRHANIKGAFAGRAAVRGRIVLLVDDVITTGATLRAATHALLDAGAARVCVAVMGRTPRW